MRIASDRFIEPTRNGAYAVAAIALSLFIFAYSTRFGMASILVYYAIWFPLFLIDLRILTERPQDLVLPLALAAFMMLSVTWSDAASTSLRAAIQYLTHFICALAAARVVNLRSLTRGMVIGGVVVVLYSLAFGYYAYDMMDGTYTFVGAFGSKNQLGLYCSLGIFFAAVLVLVMREHRLVKLAAIGAAGLFAVVLMLAQSATSVIALALSLVVLAATLGFLRFSPRMRIALLVLLVPVGALIVAVSLQGGAADAVLGLFGKDSTLTGRTYLWDQGIRAGLEHPWIGVGYQAYWVQGFSEAERLWEEFYIPTRTGFHFHSTYIESFVEIGVLGTGLIVLILLSVLWRLCARIVSARDSQACCLLALFVMFLIRSFAEVDVLTPYTVGAFLIFFMYLVRRGQPATRPRPAPARLPGFSPADQPVPGAER